MEHGSVYVIYAWKNVGIYHGIVLVQAKNSISAKYAQKNKIENHHWQTQQKDNPKFFFYWVFIVNVTIDKYLFIDY